MTTDPVDPGQPDGAKEARVVLKIPIELYDQLHAHEILLRRRNPRKNVTLADAIRELLVGGLTAEYVSKKNKSRKPHS